jgi:hypothetical protein
MNTFLSTKIELWSAEKLIPYNRNARTHSDEQIEQIARSIQKFGFTNPILVDTGAGILAGHARLRGIGGQSCGEVDLIQGRRSRSSRPEALFLPLVHRLAACPSTLCWDERDCDIRIPNAKASPLPCSQFQSPLQH